MRGEGLQVDPHEVPDYRGEHRIGRNEECSENHQGNHREERPTEGSLDHMACGPSGHVRSDLTPGLAFDQSSASPCRVKPGSRHGLDKVQGPGPLDPGAPRVESRQR